MRFGIRPSEKPDDWNEASSLGILAGLDFSKMRLDSWEQQDRFIAILSTLLSCRGYDDLKGLNSERTRGVLKFSDILKQKLENGTFIK